MAQQDRGSNLPPPLIAIAGWLIPGAGYWLIGERTRAGVIFASILLLYLLGLLIGGVRVIEVPGYDSQSGRQIRMLGRQIISPTDDMRYPQANWSLLSGGFVPEIANKPWFAGQILAGPICIISSYASMELAQQSSIDYPRPHAASETVATLYTAIAGMLNLMVIIDSTYRASQPAPETRS